MLAILTGAALTGACGGGEPTPTGDHNSSSIPGAASTGAASTNSRIAFQSDRDGNFEIYVMNADGSSLTRLTNHSSTDVDPTWSPDGRKIAFASNRDGNGEIYTMNADGSSLRRLTNNPAFDAVPSWSPDGQKIAFASDRFVNSGGAHFWGIYVMEVDGSNVVATIAPFSDSDPAWSPDGRRIAFVSIRQGDPVYPINDILTMNPDGSALSRLTDDPAADGFPAWSPAGSAIAFVTTRDYNSEIYVMNADGSAQTRLTNHDAFDGSPSWSPDGRQIAFSSNRDGDLIDDGRFNVEIYTMNADGSDVRRLTNSPGSDSQPAWSP
jgi:Tol biopolymer transport system component